MFYLPMLLTVCYVFFHVFLIQKYYLKWATLSVIFYTFLTFKVFAQYEFVAYFLVANLMFILMLIAAFFTRPRLFVFTKEEKEHFY